MQFISPRGLTGTGAFSPPRLLPASWFVSRDASPAALGSPKSRAQAFELNNLAVIDEQVHLGAIVLDVPFEDRRIGGFEHHRGEPKAVDEGGNRIGSPRRAAFGSALRLDHDPLGAGAEPSPRQSAHSD